MGRLAGLEALRGIAALIVAYNHAAYFYGYEGLDTRLLIRGHIAVDLFFMLSGFVLARAFEGRMPSPRHFLVMRFRRLWLLMAIGTALGAGYFALLGSSLWELAPHVVFGLMILPVIGFTIALNPPAWSIFFELVANGLHAAVLQHVSIRVLIGLVALCAAVMLPFIDQYAMNIGQGGTFWLGFPRVIMSYAIGIVLYRWNGDRRRLPAALAWPLLMALPVCVALLGETQDLRLELAAVLMLGPVMLLGALSLGDSRLANLIGAISFPLYAVHVPVQWFVIHWGGGWALALAVSLVAGVGLAFDRNCRAAFGLARFGAWRDPRVAGDPSR